MSSLETVVPRDGSCFNKDLGDGLLDVLQMVYKTRKALDHELSLSANWQSLEQRDALSRAEIILKGLWLRVMTRDLEHTLAKKLVKIKLKTAATAAATHDLETKVGEESNMWDTTGEEEEEVEEEDNDQQQPRHPSHTRSLPRPIPGGRHGRGRRGRY